MKRCPFTKLEDFWFFYHLAHFICEMINSLLLDKYFFIMLDLRLNLILNTSIINNCRFFMWAEIVFVIIFRCFLWDVIDHIIHFSITNHRD